MLLFPDERFQASNIQTYVRSTVYFGSRLREYGNHFEKLAIFTAVTGGVQNAPQNVPQKFPLSAVRSREL